MRVFKNFFRHRNARCNGLAKNTAQVVMLFGVANLELAKKRSTRRTQSPYGSLTGRLPFNIYFLQKQEFSSRRDLSSGL